MPVPRNTAQSPSCALSIPQGAQAHTEANLISSGLCSLRLSGATAPTRHGVCLQLLQPPDFWKASSRDDPEQSLPGEFVFLYSIVIPSCTKKNKLERVARWKQKAKHVRAQLSRSVFVLPPSSSHMLPAELTRGVLELDFFSFASCCLHRISDSAARCSLMPEQDE